jgi:hypothetical protein
MIPENPLKKLIELKRRYFRRNAPYCVYGRRLWDETTILLTLLFITVLISSGLFFIAKLLWYAYALTPVGKEYISIFTENSQAIFAIFSRGCIKFSIELTLHTFSVCLIICTLCQLLSISRFFYIPREFFGKLCFWGLSMAAAGAVYLRPIYNFAEWEMALFLSVVPTLVMFNGCFRFTGLLLPELYDIIVYLIKKGGVIKKYIPGLRQKAQDIIDRINAS